MDGRPLINACNTGNCVKRAKRFNTRFSSPRETAPDEDDDDDHDNDEEEEREEIVFFFLSVQHVQRTTGK